MRRFLVGMALVGSLGCGSQAPPPQTGREPLAEPVVAVSSGPAEITTSPVAVPGESRPLPPPEVGNSPGDFRLPVVTADDPNPREFRLANSRGPVVLLFFPEAATPGCTKELCAFRDQHETFVEYGATVLAVSADSPEKLREWAKAEKFPFLLGSDPDGRIASQFGSWNGDEAKRTMFVIAPMGSHVLYRELEFDLNDLPGELEAARKHLTKG